MEKRLRFKKPFNGMENAIKLIPEAYKVDGKEFQITDGAETYDVRWDINEVTVLRAENKNLINEDMKHIKHLMGFKSQDTLGTLKGKERVNENSSFTDVWGKTKKLLSESEEAKGIEESEEEVSESKDVDNYMDAKNSINKLDTLATKVNTREEKIEAAVKGLQDIADGDKALINKIAREAMKVANKMSEGEACEENDMKEGEEFPDLTGDGKVTQADVLKGRGVELDEGEMEETEIEENLDMDRLDEVFKDFDFDND